MTKAQERKALEEIKAILEKAGADSYIGMAFAGCVEDAEENIENDFALSWRDRAVKAQENAIYFNKIANLEAGEHQKKDAEIAELKARITELNNMIDEMHGVAKKAHDELIEERKEIHITVKGEKTCKPFWRMEYYNDNGFQFVTVKEKNGWCDSYKLEDIETLVIA